MLLLGLSLVLSRADPIEERLGVDIIELFRESVLNSDDVICVEWW
jgi:hypothetical protein